MKTQINHGNLRKVTLIFSFLLFNSLIANVSADDVNISLTANGCEVEAVVAGPNGCDDDSCNGDSSCVCTAKGDHVNWQLNIDSEKFKIKFSEDSPLKDNCGKNFKKEKQRCVVKDDVSKGQVYQYEIVIEACAQGSDPKIVIK